MAADRIRWVELEQALRHYLAWKSIEEDVKHQRLNLDTFQNKQVSTKSAECEATVKARFPETFIWL
ncbi:MAG: hypothetical protein R2880_19035 [Deinococcales bacterium]